MGDLHRLEPVAVSWFGEVPGGGYQPGSNGEIRCSFVFFLHCPRASSGILAGLSPVEPTKNPESPIRRSSPFYFRNQVTCVHSTFRAYFAYNFLTHMKGGQFSSAAMTAIDILGLEKTYSVGFWRKKPRCALKPLHLRVEEGEIFGFLGPNGAGKTTTLKILMGLVYPTAGSAQILGMDINDPRMKAQIGFLPEQPYFYDYLTAGELLNYYGQLSGVLAKDRERKVREVLERVGLPDVMRVQLRKFSKGMLQRVGIAQAILHDPRIVFFDEPMSGLDPMGRREVRDLMEELSTKVRRYSFPRTFFPTQRHFAIEWQSFIWANCGAWVRSRISPRASKAKSNWSGMETRSLPR